MKMNIFSRFEGGNWMNQLCKNNKTLKDSSKHGSELLRANSFGSF